MNYKAKLISALSATIQIQIDELISEVDSVNEEIGKETKSSAGDKFETSREMMTQERNRIEERISLLNRNSNTLSNLPNKAILKITNGSLVVTSLETFFFGIPFGKFIFENEVIMVLSLNSPIGKAFFNKQEGNNILFLKKHYSINSVS